MGVFVASVAGAMVLMTGFVEEEQSPPRYPETQRKEVLDDYHGTRVPDPYRWLEDDTSTETAAWVAAQNSLTQPYLQQVPFRAELQARVLQLNDYEKYSAPSRKGPLVCAAARPGSWWFSAMAARAPAS